MTKYIKPENPITLHVLFFFPTDLSTAQQATMTAVKYIEDNEFMIDNGYHLDTYGNTSCMDDDCINHNITCVGEPLYCNYTYEEYVQMLYDYIYPSVSEWILIFSHAVVFFMGLVSNKHFNC